MHVFLAEGVSTFDFREIEGIAPTSCHQRHSKQGRLGLCSLATQFYGDLLTTPFADT